MTKAELNLRDCCRMLAKDPYASSEQYDREIEATLSGANLRTLLDAVLDVLAERPPAGEEE